MDYKTDRDTLKSDLNHILEHTSGLWEDLRGKHIFISGGTGFFGRWLLESLLWANHYLDLNLSLLVLTRNPDAFSKKVPHLVSDPAIRLYKGDIRDFPFPQENFSHIIHAAATSAVATFNNEDPLIKFDTVVYGTRRILDFAIHCQAKKFLYISSGAVYGPQPNHISHITEDFCGAPSTDNIHSVWGIGKRSAEFLCTYYHSHYGIETKIARCFSFVGPFLQTDIHYAIGNFIRDALKGGPICIKGDGTPVRSYLYASDLMIWLWTILIKGEAGSIYNVGSEHALSIKELARTIVDRLPMNVEISMAQKPNPTAGISRYVPSTHKAKNNLGLQQTINLEDAIDKTLNFVRLCPDSHSTDVHVKRPNEREST
jgi:nucleoside-diphosphate-sugar epimerase